MPATATDRIDGLTTSVAVKAPVVAVSSGNLTLDGEQTVNGVAVVEGDRVLVKNQTSSVDNGIYVASTGNWERARDFDGNRDVVNGTRVFWAGGDGWWRVVSNDVVVVGTDAVIFVATEMPSHLLVSQFGAVGDGVTDDTAAIQAACAAMEISGVRRLLFDATSYLIYPTGTLSGSISMNSFTGVDGIHLDGCGAELIIEDVFANGEILTHFAFNDCKHLRVENFTFTQTVDTQANSETRGQRPVTVTNGSKFITCKNIFQTGGLSGFTTDRNTALADPTQKSSFIHLENWECYRVGYPWNFQNSGDYVFGRGLRANECGRAFFAYGVRYYDVEVTNDNGFSSPGVLLYAGYGLDEDCCHLEDINIRVRSNKDGIGNATQANTMGIGVNFVTGLALPSVVRNIDIDLDVEMVPDISLYKVFTIGKIVDSGVIADTTDRGHIVENLTLGGVITKADTVGGQGAIFYLFDGADSAWGTGEFVRGVRFRDLIVTGTGSDTDLHIGVGPIMDHLVFENVSMPTEPTFYGTAQLGTLYRNCVFGSTVYSDRIHSVQVRTDAGAVDLTHRTTHIVTTGAAAITLAAGIQNLRKTITMVTDGGDATLTVTNGGGYNTLTFDALYDTVELEYLNSKWVILSNVGVVVT